MSNSRSPRTSAAATSICGCQRSCARLRATSPNTSAISATDCNEVDAGEARFPGACFDLGDPEQGIERRVDLIALGPRIGELGGDVPAFALGFHRLLDHQPQPVERRLQIMGDVDADLPHALEEAGEPLKRVVHLHRQHVDVVAVAGELNARGKLALRDPAHRRGDGLHAPLDADRQRGAAGERQHQHQCGGRGEAGQRDLVDLADFGLADPDQQPVAAELAGEGPVGIRRRAGRDRTARASPILPGSSRAGTLPASESRQDR